MRAHPRPLTRPRTASMLVLLAPLLVCACTGGQSQQVFQPANYLPSFPITVVPASRHLRMPLDDTAMPAMDRTALTSFVLEHARKGAGPIEVSGPAGAVRAGAHALVALGAGPGELALHIHRNQDWLDMRFATTRAITPDCGTFSSDNPRTGLADSSNAYSSEMGCTTQSNFAAMLSDPTDALARRGDLPGRVGNSATGRMDAIHAYTAPEKPMTNDTSSGGK